MTPFTQVRIKVGQFYDLFTRTKGYPNKRIILTLTPFLFFLCRVYKAPRVTRVGGLPYLCARVTLAGGLTFFLVNTPGN